MQILLKDKRICQKSLVYLNHTNHIKNFLPGLNNHVAGLCILSNQYSLHIKWTIYLQITEKINK